MSGCLWTVVGQVGRIDDSHRDAKGGRLSSIETLPVDPWTIAILIKDAIPNDNAPRSATMSN
jgi:hypothetical protein